MAIFSLMDCDPSRCDLSGSLLPSYFPFPSHAGEQARPGLAGSDMPGLSTQARPWSPESQEESAYLWWW